MKLNSKTVAALVIPPGKTDVIFVDEELPRFGLRLRLGAKGEIQRTWIIQYRQWGESRRIRLGSAGLLSLEQARATARKLLLMVELGEDPRANKLTMHEAYRAAKIMRANLRMLHDRIADKAATFLAQGLEPKAYLYRHYQPNGDLLYAGCTLSIPKRTSDHLRDAPWKNLICLIIIEPFATREEALEAERIAVRTEFPKYNTVYNKRRPPVEEMARA
jgi:hypothetical protein